MTDPYNVLGVAREVSDEELTRAYRKLAKRYHPDMNSGSKAAERRMQEINAAYDQIKNERSGVGARPGGSGGYGYGYGGGYGSGSYGDGSYGNGYGYGDGHSGGGADGSYGPSGSSSRGPDPFGNNYGRYGRQSDGRYDPFGGFGGFGGFDWYGEPDDADNAEPGVDGGDERDPKFMRVENFLRTGNYQTALQLLYEFDAAVRGAMWFYYSAIANAGVGNRVTALRHAQEAVRLAPNVAVYRTLLYQLERGGYVYRQTGVSQGFDMRNIGRALMQCLFSQLLCYCFCCRPC